MSIEKFTCLYMAGFPLASTLVRRLPWQLLNKCVTIFVVYTTKLNFSNRQIPRKACPCKTGFKACFTQKCLKITRLKVAHAFEMVHEIEDKREVRVAFTRETIVMGLLMGHLHEHE